MSHEPAELQKDDGGQAFPHGDPTNGGDIGMTLRDYFAIHSPWSRANFLGDPTDEAVRRVAADRAKLAYAFADAMLAQRAR